MSMTCERCGNTWPTGYAESVGLSYHDCPHCGRQETLGELLTPVAKGIATLVIRAGWFALDVAAVLVMVGAAHWLANRIGVDPMALLLAACVVYAVRKGGK